MFLSKILCCGISLAVSLVLFAQTDKSWNQKKCAVVLTYDDALYVHLDNAIPLLDSLQLKGTFYLTCHAPAFRNRVSAWRSVAARGHELANHSLFHPCNGNLPGREWVRPEYNLATYTLSQMRDELRMTNTTLEATDGKTQRTFAYPCGDMQIGDSFYLDKKEFVAARGVKEEMSTIDKVDLYNTGAFMINGQTGEQLIALVKKAIETKTLLVFLFHGVGGEHSLNVSLEAHRQLLQFLKENEKDIWNATFLEVAEFVREKRKGGSF